MGRLFLLALRVVLGTVLVGSLFVQLVMVPLVAITENDRANAAPVAVQVPLIAIAVLGILTIQVTVVCVWRLLTMVQRGTVFSHSAFRYVDVVFAAMVAACLLGFGLAVTLALAPDGGAAPDDEVAPGLLLLICGAAVIAAGIALIVLVLRMLLDQAVSRDAEAQHLQAELDAVI